MNLMNIGQAAAAAGVTPKMIRHYESLGLIPDVQRTNAGYRLYSLGEVDMLRFIRQSRALGFSIKQIGSLMSLWRDDHRASREVKELAQQQLAELDQRQREIDDMRATLAGLVARCAGDDDPHCAILEQLSTSAGPAEGVATRPAGKTLKQVRAGSTAASGQKRAPPQAQAPEPSPVAGLMAWSRGLTPHR